MPTLLLDTANLEEIEFWSPCAYGVTTNLSIMSKEEKGDYLTKLLKIKELLVKLYHPDAGRCPHLSAEVTTLDPSEMLIQAHEMREKLVSLSPKIDLYVKIPVLPQTLSVIKEVRRCGVRVNATACMTILQAKMASDAGADIVSFFFNRMVDQCQLSCGNTEYTIPESRETVLKEIADYVKLNDNARIVIDNIRKKEDVSDCFKILRRADHVTAGPKILREMMTHPQTDKVVEQFQKDICV